MPGLYRDEGVVLKTIKLGEADRIVTLFLREQGKVRAVAKGIRKTKSRFGARLEPFTRVRLIVYRGRNLDTITSADIITSFDRVRTEYPSLVSAAAIAELVEKITPDRERAFSTYALLIAGLQALAQGKGATIVPAFLVKLLSVSGYHPQLHVCAGCGRRDGLGAFSPALGGAVCKACWSEDRDAFRMEPARLDLLARLLASEFGERAGPDEVKEVTQALRLYAEYHLERPLRSLHLLNAS
jgi:DNA repair protein RecO (recombination protein O)